MLLRKEKHKQNSISKTHEVIPPLCTVIARLQLECFAEFCVLLSSIAGGLAEKQQQ